MKKFALISLVLSSMLLSNIVVAEEAPSSASVIPTLERDFVNAIHGFDKTKIIEQFGEPASAEDVKIKDSNKVVASIWHYHYINTAVDGSYYQTTELDFIDDKVVMVVFMNHDGTDKEVPGQQYQIPSEKPDL